MPHASHRTDRPQRKMRHAALAGIGGPLTFIGAWALGATTTKRHYSSVDDPISRLAAIGADSRPLMTAGFVAFGVALPIYATALRRADYGKAWLSAAATGIATLGVAAAPLDHSATVDRWHGLFAGAGYITLAAAPLLAARPQLRNGRRAAAGFALTAGGLSALSLALTITDLPTGLLQRIGLTAGDIWLIASAISIDRSRRAAARTESSL